jgi:hypothetical protein
VENSTLDKIILNCYYHLSTCSSAPLSSEVEGTDEVEVVEGVEGAELVEEVEGVEEVEVILGTSSNEASEDSVEETAASAFGAAGV